MKVAFFHGLESDYISDKSEYLKEYFDVAYCPKMNYLDKEIYNKILEYIKSQHFDLLIGSSIGGWMSYCLSLDTGINTILFNPSFDNKLIDIQNGLGNIKSNHTIIIGEYDDVVPPLKTKNYIKEFGIGNFDMNYEPNGHRTPLDVFKKYLKKYI